MDTENPTALIFFVIFASVFMAAARAYRIWAYKKIDEWRQQQATEAHEITA